ncbi:MAG: ERF family protein [Armatimonadia bacterium]
MKVYQSINAVMRDLAAEGISKSRKNTQQNYQFRGIDDVYNALSSVLSRHGLVMLPRVLSRHVEERASKNGGVLFYVSVDMEFDLVAAEDGSKHTIRTAGEAMDSGDKATNKAMSAAYKYAAMQAFCIPTEGDNDADATTHDVAPRKKEDGSRAPADWMSKIKTTIRSAENLHKLSEIRAYINERGLCSEQRQELAAICDEIEKTLEVEAL